MSIVTEHDPSIPQAFRATAGARGDQPVLFGGGSTLTFAELDRASDRIAAGLAQLGVALGERIGLFCPNAPEFVLAYLGILKAGATVVPINLMLNPKEIGFILSDSGAKGLIYHQTLSQSADQVRTLVPALECLVGIGDEEGAEHTLARLAASTHAVPELPSDVADHLAAILYTSGTTGRPKGAMLSHRNLMANATSVTQALNLEPGRDRVLVVLPMFHAFAATVGMLVPLLHGLALVIVERFDPKLVSAAILDQGATIFLGVPSMFGLLLRQDERIRAQWSSIRFCVSGGSAMPKALMAAFERRFGIPILEGDGPTECSPVTCVNPPAGPRKPGSVGLPVPGVEMRIAASDGTWLADAEHGEVCVRGANVMQGYWRRAAETAESFFGDWFRTGDLGYRDADGYFFLVDRIKDLIITNGMNVYPRMIEEVLYRHPEVVEAAVVGESHRLHGEIPIAFVVTKLDSRIEPSQLRYWCKEHLGRHEIPRRIELCEALPRNAAGKVLKRELRRHGELELGVGDS